MYIRKHTDHVIFNTDTSQLSSIPTSSSHECTGLITHAPVNEYELDSYDDIVNYQSKYIPSQNKK